VTFVPDGTPAWLIIATLVFLLFGGVIWKAVRRGARRLR
jgi:hypothetical protein